MGGLKWAEDEGGGQSWESNSNLGECAIHRADDWNKKNGATAAKKDRIVSAAGATGTGRGRGEKEGFTFQK